MGLQAGDNYQHSLTTEGCTCKTFHDFWAPSQNGPCPLWEKPSNDITLGLGIKAAIVSGVNAEIGINISKLWRDLEMTKRILYFVAVSIFGFLMIVGMYYNAVGFGFLKELRIFDFMQYDKWNLTMTISGFLGGLTIALGGGTKIFNSIKLNKFLIIFGIVCCVLILSLELLLFCLIKN